MVSCRDYYQTKQQMIKFTLSEPAEVFVEMNDSDVEIVTVKPFDWYLNFTLRSIYLFEASVCVPFFEGISNPEYYPQVVASLLDNVSSLADYDDVVQDQQWQYQLQAGLMNGLADSINEELNTPHTSGHQPARLESMEEIKARNEPFQTFTDYVVNLAAIDINYQDVLAWPFSMIGSLFGSKEVQLKKQEKNDQPTTMTQARIKELSDENREKLKNAQNQN